jgi:hypothetical protein
VAQALGGRVVDAATKQPIAKVRVSVRVDTGRVRGETLRDGTFLLPLPGAGRYVVEFTLDAGPAYRSDSITVAADAFVQQEFPLARRPDPAYWEFQVDEPVRLRPGTTMPPYPRALLANAVDGEVLVQFIVDSTGRVRPGSGKVLQYTDTAFVRAVGAYLQTVTYLPARRNGRPVAQIVQQPFRFRVTGGDAEEVAVAGRRRGAVAQ